MEAGSEGEKKKPPEGGEAKSKRQMKTAYQLELLEKTYSVEAYPSDALRAELSEKLGLSDRQLQMWFCHRRMKDRKPAPMVPPVVKRHQQRKDSSRVQGGVPENGEERVLGESGTRVVSLFSNGVDSRAVVSRPGVVATPSTSAAGGGNNNDVSAMKMYYQPSPAAQLSTAENRAIGYVEAQLGEALKDDGPILGMEFDPLPPGAFGAPIATIMHSKKPWKSFEPKIYKRPDAKPPKGSVRTPREYQFLPEQPTTRIDKCEVNTLSHHIGSSSDDPNGRTLAVSAGSSFINGDEQVASGYGFPVHLSSSSLLSRQGRQGHPSLPASREYKSVPLRDSFITTTVDTNFVTHTIATVDNPIVSSERRLSLEEDVARMERKRKNEEAKIAREAEAHEKRIRKEIEKQDMLRRKREEQIRKEMERHERERRKEEERLLREKQREEERCLREHRREVERREKFLQKEVIRAEKLRQKEEMRREKEAARLKAANERAIARKIAKESMELIEDERLELMEFAASTKGLPSIASLDFETLQNLDLFRDKLSVFPPKVVQLRSPFGIEPWSSSDENIGNLLMVWRFLSTFSDVLELWPFTLDEFVQAFHDYDPRLLGEINIALLRIIIKDIEDVAKTPAIGLGANQNCAANLGSGHPHVVEGAYTWGFDIRTWQHHLTVLTWVEILRQFALSAGFGPLLKRRNIEQENFRDDNEGGDGEDVITTLRNGAAAENAVIKMQERGFSNPRRSRHRLTPGTVKYAAFHILSLEGSEGLTIFEVSEKIQESRLRDLTTSKTPEASIAAALSRDTKLFERTAPSTYCVRPAYRKDPADADAILFSARERIRIFKTGVVEEDDADDAERDDDSESDLAEDVEVDDLVTDLNQKNDAHNSQETDNSCLKTPFGNGNQSSDVIEDLNDDLGNACEGSSFEHMNEVKRIGDAGVGIGVDSPGALGTCSITASLDKLDANIDENYPGEPWVQGLGSGDYADLSVEERLNALVALVEVAIEGKSIHAILEERLEAASALKKQLWAEVQLDKRRMKEEFVIKTHYPLYVGNKSEPNVTIALGEGRQSPMVSAHKSNETSVNPIFHQDRLNDSHVNQNIGSIPFEDNLQGQDTFVGPDNVPSAHTGYAIEKPRSQIKSCIGYRAEEIYTYRSLPLGQDRRRNRYWRFTTSPSWNDPGCGRIFVELHEGRWRLIDSEEGLDHLLASLDVRGVKESHLHSMLQKIEMSFKEAVRKRSGNFIEVAPGPVCNLVMDNPCSTSGCGSNSDLAETSTSFTIQLGSNETEKEETFKRYLDLEKWMVKESLNSPTLRAVKYGTRRCRELIGLCDCCHDAYYFKDSQCPSCHKTLGNYKSELDLFEDVPQFEEKLSIMHGSVSSPLRIRLLKALLAVVEVSIPSEALQPIWSETYRESWGLKLHSSTSAKELFKSLTLLESAVRRDYLSSKFETTSELLGAHNPLQVAASDLSATELVSVLPWVPITTAAVALRLIAFDNSIAYTPSQKVEPHNDGDMDFNGSSLFSTPHVRGSANRTDPNQVVACPEEVNWFEVARRQQQGYRGRGRGRTRGGKSQRQGGGYSKNIEGLSQISKCKGQTSGRKGRKRGRHITKSMMKPRKQVQIVDEKDKLKETIIQKSTTSNDWKENEMDRLQLDGFIEAGSGGSGSSSSGRSDFNDENSQPLGDDYDDGKNYTVDGSTQSRDDALLDDSYYNVDGEEEDDDVDDIDEQGGFGVEDYINDDDSYEDVEVEDPNSFSYEGMTPTSSSSEYSE